MKKLEDLSCAERAKLRLVEIETHLKWIIHPLNNILFEKADDVKEQIRSVLNRAGSFPLSKETAKQLKRCTFCNEKDCVNSIDIST